MPVAQARRWAPALLIAVLAATAAAAPRSAPNSPNRPAASVAGVKIRGIDYIDARGFLARYGLKASWVEAGKTMQFQSASTKIVLTINRSEIDFNGLRLTLGEPAAAHAKSLFICTTDAYKIFAAILRPSAIDAPAAPIVQTIVLDPGHGGIDPGKENDRLKLVEKKLTLDTALRLKKILEAGGYRVLLTRADDRHLSVDKATDLARRADVANRAGADLFVSIHYNAFVQTGVNGTETYIVTRPNQRSTGLPERDPAVPANRMDAWNAVLGYTVHRQLIGRLKSFDRGLKFARYKIITLVNCPGILVESGFLTNDAEGRKIATPAYRQEIAEAIAAGVNAYAEQVKAARQK